MGKIYITMCSPVFSINRCYTWLSVSWEIKRMLWPTARYSFKQKEPYFIFLQINMSQTFDWECICTFKQKKENKEVSFWTYRLHLLCHGSYLTHSRCATSINWTKDMLSVRCVCKMCNTVVVKYIVQLCNFVC